jgi:hypothetical protein
VQSGQKSGSILHCGGVDFLPYARFDEYLAAARSTVSPQPPEQFTNAEKSPTSLLADVEVVAAYKLYNVNRSGLENIFHRLFGSVQFDLVIQDRLGHPVQPREWFLVSLQVIDEAVARILDGAIATVVYDQSTARLVSV